MIYSVPFPATCFVDCKAPNILFRSIRLFFCATGLRLIDSLFTIASGQRVPSITPLTVRTHHPPTHTPHIPHPLRPTHHHRRRHPHQAYAHTKLHQDRSIQTLMAITNSIASTHHTSSHQHHRIIVSSSPFHRVN